MKVTVIETDSNEPWSLSGWTLNYIQLDENTYGFNLTDPSGELHKSSISDGWFIYYNVSSIGNLIKMIVSKQSSDVSAAVRKYNLKNQIPKSIKL